MKKSYRCIELDPANFQLKIAERTVADLHPDQVLVQVWGSPINPSDRLFCKGVYGSPAKSPTIPGFEGVGTVVASGSGFMARRLLRKRVSGAVQGQEGFWAEYVVLPAKQCLVLPDSISNETAACAFVNPLTALALMEPLRKKKFYSLVQTGAASQLGRMIYRLCQKQNIPSIHVVHRPELKESLLREGYQEVLDSSSSSFLLDLTQKVKQYDVHYALDSVAGNMTHLLAQALPEKSQIVVYGILSGKNCEVSPGDLIFKDIALKGFWLSHWLQTKNPLQLGKVFYDLKKFLRKEGQTQVARKLNFEQAVQDILNPSHQDSSGKTLVLPATF